MLKIRKREKWLVTEAVVYVLMSCIYTALWIIVGKYPPVILPIDGLISLWFGLRWLYALWVIVR